MHGFHELGLLHGFSNIIILVSSTANLCLGFTQETNEFSHHCLEFLPAILAGTVISGKDLGVSSLLFHSHFIVRQ
jgi:hypothetical protein